MASESGEETEGMLEEGESVCMSFSPQLHALMMARQRRRSSCCPQMFERANDKWWNPRFDSDILETQYVNSSMPKLTQRFRHALGFLVLSCVIWSIYWIITLPMFAWAYIGCAVILSAFAVGVTIFSYKKIYQRYRVLCASTISILLMFAILLPFGLQLPWNNLQSAPSLVTLFIFYVKIVLVVYTMLPLPLYICVLMTALFTVVFEMMVSLLVGDNFVYIVAIRLLLYLCVHVIGFHVMIMNEVRMRGTFMSIGQSLLVRRQLQIEKALKEKMIHSVMPRKVADWLMKETPGEGLETDIDDFDSSRKMSTSRAAAGTDFRLATFRPFNMNSMENVSILFADIVGFTKMSSNKTAEHLVGLLNDLFGRFDQLCVQTHCEKISTLGDCYYCVSGCPIPRVDHATCCVRMGLAMIKAIKQFDEDNNESVDMRVGVHTGKVLCGIVGTKRFKFDVWSSDVTLANKMESTGKPGYVHISEVTKSFLPDDVFIIEPGQPIQVLSTHMDTYFISRKVVDSLPEVQIILPPQTLIVQYEADEDTELRSKSMPNMVGFPLKDELIENLEKPKIPSRHTFSPNVDMLKKKLPRLVKPAKSKTTSLPKISPRTSDSPMVDDKKLADNSKEMELTIMPISCSTPASPAVPTTEFNFPSTAPAEEITEEEVWSSEVKDPRKDSGIRSHRSSIQMVSINGLSTGDLLSHRVSDYFTSSQASFNEMKMMEDVSSAQLSNDTERRFLRLRKQSDIQMINCVKKEPTSLPYDMVTPLSPFTLCFTDKSLEKKYHQIAHCARKDEPRTLASTYYNTYFDVIITTVVFSCIGACLILLFGIWAVWVSLYVLFVLIHLLMLALCTSKINAVSSKIDTKSHIYDKLTKWWPWHCCGGFLLCLPFMAIFINMNCNKLSEDEPSLRYFCCITAVSLIYFCNFTQLNCWMKNIVATLCTLGFLVFVATPICPCPVNVYHYFHGEIGLAYVMLLLLVWLMNREFEIAYRLSFYGYLMAVKDKAHVQSMKDQAEWLLHNIIPKDVADVIKSKSKYSENHSDIGVMFASIYNFNELYNEDYMGGKEYLRILNELLADFDELLSRDDFRNIEKIKTIGSTYMAASGLSKEIRRTNIEVHQQLYELLQFAIEMQKVMDSFNQNLIGFNLMLRIGINYGEVTAGVIGTTKLYYDIWGDTVNIASRMDSTGVPNRIQVTGRCAQVLKQKYKLESRGKVFVKGKDNMDVYLVVNDK